MYLYLFTAKRLLQITKIELYIVKRFYKEKACLNYQLSCLSLYKKEISWVCYNFIFNKETFRWQTLQYFFLLSPHFRWILPAANHRTRAVGSIGNTYHLSKYSDQSNLPHSCGFTSHVGPRQQQNGRSLTIWRHL